MFAKERKIRPLAENVGDILLNSMTVNYFFKHYIDDGTKFDLVEIKQGSGFG